MIHHGDCLAVLPTLEAESVDAIVTDPPYGLGFMGKAWDDPSKIGDSPMRRRPELDAVNAGASRQGGRQRAGDDYQRRQARDMREFQAWCERWAAECYRVAKPGAHLLAFGGTRTVHRIASAIEDAGWEIRDTIVWAYASGFPKSLDVSKAIDKAAGAHREVVGRRPDWQVSDQWRESEGRKDRPESLLNITAPATPEAEQWQGWGTALKPAWEPIVLARKPLRGTVAGNVLAHGTGALNIDGTRIGPPLTPEEIARTGGAMGVSDGRSIYGEGHRAPAGSSGLGRWPANVILTDPIFDGDTPGVVGGGEAASGGNINGRPVTGYMKGWADERFFDGYGDSGTYSRFFLIPKAARSDREPVLPETALAFHRASGECDKLQAWENEGRSPGELTVITSPGRATSEDDRQTEASSSGTSSPGSPLTDPSLTATRSTTSTGTRPTTGSTTSSSSIPSPTSGSIPAASSETASGGSPAASADSSSLWGLTTGTSPERDGRSTDDAGRATSRGLSRGNVCAACGKPLGRVTTHPTVKPTELMRHLVRLVTPPGGTVLDPFLGSGTTALAAEMEGFAWVGIEREAEYVAIAEARLNGTQRGLGLSA